MTTNGWVPLGPSCIPNGQVSGKEATVSGRCTAIVAHPTNPDIVYAGAASGGVWLSTDRGLHWKPIMDQQVTLAVGAMLLDPANPDRLYVGTGEGNDGSEVLHGYGLLIYDSGGWEVKTDGLLKGQRVSGMAIESRPGADNRILMATTNGLLESTDDGKNWSQVTVRAGAPNARADAVLLVQNPDPAQSILYVALHEDGIYRRVGTGAWQPLPKGAPDGISNDPSLGRIALGLCRDHPNCIYAACAKNNGEILGLYQSASGGDHWTRVPNPHGTLEQGHYNLVLAVHPSSGNIVFFGETSLWRSTTGGGRWEEVSNPHGDSQGLHSDQHAVVFDPSDPTRVWAGNDGGVWLSTDGGTSFFSRNRGLQTIQFYSLAQHPAFDALLLGGAQDNGPERYEGAPGWNSVDTGDGFFCAIDAADPRHWYGSYVFWQDGKIKAISRSDKAGKPDSFDVKVDGIRDTFPPNGSKPGYTPFVIDPSQTNVLYLGTNMLYRTENRGDEWRAIRQSDVQEFTTGHTAASTITALAVDPSDSSVVYAGTYNGHVFHLRRGADGNYTVTDLSAGLPGAYIADIAVPATTPASNKVYVAIGVPQISGVPVPSIAAGRIFVAELTGTPPVARWRSLMTAQLDLTINGVAVPHAENPVNAIAIDPASHPETVYIGCNIGVFKTIDGGANWSEYRVNLPNAAIADLQFHAAKRLLRAATIGRSVWESAVDAPAGGSGVDLYIRDNLVDTGRATTPLDIVHPLDPSERLRWTSGADIKIDTPFLNIGSYRTPASTEDYTSSGAADYIAFQKFGTHDFRRKTTSRIYVEALNRGPDQATNVRVRAFYCGTSGGSVYEDLPADFWTHFPDSDPAPGHWRPLGAVRAIPILYPAEPRVVSWEFEMPESASDTVGVLAIATSNEDPNTETRLVVSQIATENKRIALREVSVNAPALNVVLSALVVLGLAAFAAYEVAENV